MKNPWKDIASYEIEDAPKFKGRDESIEKFLDILDSGTMSVLYANSGIGKTSFLKAGIEARLIDEFAPIHITLFDDKGEIEKQILNQISKFSSIKEPEIQWVSTIDAEIDELKDSLWWFLHTHEIRNADGSPMRALIVFDQFEEVFYKSREFSEQLFRLIQELYSSALPENVENVLEKLWEAGTPLEIDSKHYYKVIFSFRKEFLSDFDYWTNDKFSIPELYQNRMMLLPLTKKEANCVITEQPDGKGGYIETLYDISEDIISFIDAKGKDNVEPILLSVICKQLFDKAINKGKAKLGKDDLPKEEISLEVKSFYDSLLYQLNKQKVFKGNRDVERFEDLFVSEADGHRLRKSRDDKDIKDYEEKHEYVATENGKSQKDNPDKKTVWDNLEQVHLIRKNNVGDYTYIELIHDRFAEIIHHKQIYRKELTHDILWKSLWAFVLICLLGGTLIYNVGNSNGRGSMPYTEAQNRIVLSNDTAYRAGWFSFDNFIQEIKLVGDTSHYHFWYCDYLKRIETASNYGDLRLDIKNCPMLDRVILDKNVRNLDINIRNSPHINIYIGPGVGNISMSCDSMSTPFLVNANSRYKLLQTKDSCQILWDIENDKAVFVPNLPSKFLFPDELDSRTSFYCGGKLYKNACLDTVLRNDFGTSSIRDRISKIRSIRFEDSIKKIENVEDFTDFENLKEIRLPDNQDSIKYWAFKGLDKLETVVFPRNLKYIGFEAFKGCHSLKRVVFRNSEPLSIEGGAFADCTKLEYIEMPDSVKVLSNPVVFDNCPNIKNIRLRDPKKSNIAIKDSVLYDKESGCPIAVMSDYCRYNYKDKYYSKFGIIFRDSLDGEGNHKGRRIIYTPKNADFPSLAHDNKVQYSQAGEWVVDWLNKEIYAIGHPKELRIPVSFVKLTYNNVELSFQLAPDSLERIYCPYPQPETSQFKFGLFNIADSLKSRITLYVPYGCKKYYINNPRFASYKSIEEDSWWRRPLNILLAWSYNTQLALSNNYSLLGLIIIVLAGIVVAYKLLKTKYNIKGVYYPKRKLVFAAILYATVFFVIYTIIYWFVMLVVFNQDSCMAWINKFPRYVDIPILGYMAISLCFANIIAIPLAFCLLEVLLGRKWFFSTWDVIKSYAKRKGKNMAVFISFIICMIILLVQACNLFDFDKMYSYGKYDRAISLLYAEMMKKDSISQRDSILLRNVLLSSEGLPYQIGGKGFIEGFTCIKPFKDKNLLLIAKRDSVILLDFANHEQHKYKIPQSKSYYVDDKYVCGYSNSDYAFICKRRETVADSIKGWYLYFADNGKYVVSKTDSMCYIYDIPNKPKLIKAFHWENPSFVEVTQSSHYLAVQKNWSSPVEIYDISSGGKIFASGVKGRLSFLSDSLLITSDYEHTFIYKLNNTTLSLLHEIKGYSPTILENNGINIITKDGSYKTFFHRINNSECRTDSVNTWIYSYQIGEYSKSWNMDVVRHLKKLGKQSLISLNDRYMIVRNDSSQTTSIYDINRKCRLMKSIKGKSPDVLNSEGETLFCIENLREDSIYVYKGIEQIFKYPHNSNQSISNNCLLERFGNRVKIIRLDNPSESCLIEDEESHFPVDNCVIFGNWIFSKYEGHYDNILPTDELIDRCDYLSEKQKQGLKRKITYQSSGN